MITEFRFLVVAVVRNVEKSFKKEFSNIESIFKRAKTAEYFIVESDSGDSTVSILTKISREYENFQYISLGNLEKSIPNRIQRIRHCRNQYVHFIRTEYLQKLWDYVVVLDLDGNCKNLKLKSIESCFKTNIKWCACFSNQLLGYYDIYALRADNWVESDCLLSASNRKHNLENELKKIKDISWLRKFNMFDLIRKEEIYGKMRLIPFYQKWIPVQSAFGGAGIYKTELFLSADYSLNDIEGPIICEHVDFHLNLKNIGFDKFFINPRFINLYLNEHIFFKIKLIRFLRFLRHSRK